MHLFATVFCTSLRKVAAKERRCIRDRPPPCGRGKKWTNESRYALHISAVFSFCCPRCKSDPHALSQLQRSSSLSLAKYFQNAVRLSGSWIDDSVLSPSPSMDGLAKSSYAHTHASSSSSAPPPPSKFTCVCVWRHPHLQATRTDKAISTPQRECNHHHHHQAAYQRQQRRVS